MNYTLTPIDSCHFSIKIPINRDDVAKKHSNLLQEKQKTVEIKGYRKGKVPLSVVEKFFGEQSKLQAVYSSAWGPIDQAVTKEKIRMIGYPKFDEIGNLEQVTEVSAVLEVLPKYDVKDFKNYKFEVETPKIDTAEIEKVKDSLLKSQTEMKVKAEGEKVKDGDIVLIDFEGTLKDGTKPAEMKAENFSLDIGSGRFIPGFEEGVIGTTTGETKVIKVTFPADYHVAQYAGIEVNFKVDVKEIKEKVLPAWNETFLKQYGYDSNDDFIEKTKVRLTEQKKNESETKLRNTIIDKFLADNEWQVPPTLIEEQKRLLAEDMKKHLRDSRIKESQVAGYLNTMEKEMRAKAEKQVKTALLIENLGEKMDVKVSDQMVEDHIKEMADKNKLSIDEIKNYYQSVPKYLENLKFHLLEEGVFAQIKKTLKIEA
jgi:trigger factor